MKHLQHIFETSETLETYICNIRFQHNISLLSRVTAATTFLVGNCSSGNTEWAQRGMERGVGWGSRAACDEARGGGRWQQRGGVGRAASGRYGRWLSSITVIFIVLTSYLCEGSLQGNGTQVKFKDSISGCNTYHTSNTYLLRCHLRRYC